MRKALIKKLSALVISSVVIKGLGFLFRIYLSRTAGAEGCGLYHLVLSVYTFGAGLASFGMSQTVSKLVSKNPGHSDKILRTALTVTGAVSLLVTVIFFNFSEYISEMLLKDLRTLKSIKAVVITFPAIGAFSALSGYFNGLLKVGYPARGNLFEQITRTVFLILFAERGFALGLEQGIFTVTIGIIAGEFISTLYLLFAYKNTKASVKNNYTKTGFFGEIIKNALPIAAGGYIGSFLHTLENILLPAKLVSSGLENSAGVSVLGLIKGMASPLVFFPGIIIGAICVLTLPEISKASGNSKNLERKAKTVLISSFLTGIFSLFFFLLFSVPLTRSIYGSDDSAFYVRAISLSLPFLFVSMSGASILNGIGKQNFTLVTGMLSGLIKLSGIIFFVPRFGINGYLFFFVLSEICGFLMTCILIWHTIYKKKSLFIYKLPKMRKNNKNYLKY